MSAALRIVDRLPKAKQVGPDCWRALCPAHEGRSSSLSIRQSEDRALLHCFAGCETEDVLGSLGLGMSDLYDVPRKLRGEFGRKWKSEQTQKNSVKLIASEALRIWLACEHMLKGNSLSETDRNHLREAAKIITAPSRNVPASMAREVAVLAILAENMVDGMQVFEAYSWWLSEIYQALMAFQPSDE